MTSNSTIIRRIQYPTGVNAVGLNPLSGVLLDVNSRQRELWSLASTHPDQRSKYVETVVEPAEHDRGAHRDIVEDAMNELFDPDGYPVPAHEDIFATDVFAAITDADDIVLPADEDENDPLFFGVSHHWMQ